MTRLPVNPEFKEQFRERVKDKFGEKGLSDQKGFVKMNILEPKSFPSMPENNTFVVETYWETMEDFVAYTQSQSFADAHKDLPPKEWFTGHPTIEVYEIIKEK